MAFFDELGKKLSQAGQTAVQKTKEMTDIARINGMISDEEKKVNNNYLQIGKLYLELHQNDAEAAFVEMIASILESENKIKDFRQQIQDIKGVVRCENCGAEIANNVAFCSSCGAPAPKPEQPPVAAEAPGVVCPNCGAQAAQGSAFCVSCGTKLN